MATTLGKFGIGLQGEVGSRGIIQPKLKYKYRVRFEGMGAGAATKEYTRNVVTADRPKITYNETQVHGYNSIVYIMGKHEWATVNIVIRDDVENSVVAAIGDQIQRQVDHHNQTSAMAGADYKFSTHLEFLSGHDAIATSGTVLDRWLMEGCFFQNVDYDAGDYGASEAVQVTMILRFDNATHYKSDGTGLMPISTSEYTTQKGVNATSPSTVPVGTAG